MNKTKRMIGCRPPRPAPRAIDRHCSGLCQKRRGNAPRPCAFPPGGRHAAPCARPCGNTRRLRSNDSRALRHMRPAAAQNIRAQSGKSGPQNRWRCGRYPFVTQISLFVSEFLFSCMRLCSDTRSNVPSKAQTAFCPACIRGTFSYFTAPSFNLYIGPPSYFVSFRKSDLYIPVPPFAPPAEPCAPLDVRFRPITNAERVRGDLRKTPPPPAASKHIYLIRLPLRRYPCALFRKEPTQTCILGMQAARVLRGLWVYRKGSFGFSLLVLLL